MNVDTTTASYDITVAVSWHKPLGRGRRFERQARGLARRLRLPFVRRTRWEVANPQALTPWQPSYAPVWTSDNALANHSFACICHKGERYSRKGTRDTETSA